MCTKYIMVIDVVVVARQLTTYHLVCFDSNKCKKLNSLKHLVRTTVAGSHN